MQSGKVLDQSLERYTEAVFRTCSLEKENTREFWEISKNTFFYKTPPVAACGRNFQWSPEKYFVLEFRRLSDIFQKNLRTKLCVKSQEH